METADVVIIGAGIHGASAAFHLAHRGVRALLIERLAPAQGPTGQSSAVCRAYYGNPFLAKVARDGIDFFEHFGEHTSGRDAGFRRTGMLFLHPQRDEAQLRINVNMVRRAGTQIDVLDTVELVSQFGEINIDDIAIGVWEPAAGYADPVAATDGLIQEAVDRGARTRFYCEVTNLELRTGGGAIVTLASGERVESSRLLITAGPWSAGLARHLGVELPLTVERHIVATFHCATGIRLRYALADVVNGFYSRPEGEALVLVGPLHAEAQVDPDSYATGILDSEIVELAAEFVDRVPVMESAESAGGWASLYDVSPDWQPVVGAVESGIFVDCGTSGHGFKLAPALGRHVADLILQGKPDAELEQFDPFRFTRGASLAAGYGTARILG